MSQTYQGSAGSLPRVILVDEAGNPINIAGATPAIIPYTPGFARLTTSGTLSGMTEVSLYNAGAVDATVLNTVLKPLESVSFNAPSGGILGDIAYNATGTELIVTTLVRGI